MARTSDERERGKAVQRWDSAAHALRLFGLWTMALTQPVLEPLANQPLLLSAHQARAADLVVLTLIVVLGPVALSLLPELLLRRLAPARIRGWRVTSLALPLALLGVLLFRTAAPGAAAAVVLPIAAVAAVAIACAATAGAATATFLSFLGVVGLAVPALYLHVLLRSDAAAPPPAPSSGSPPIVLLVLDELPTTTLLDGDGRIDRELFPHLAALAGHATWYRDAVSVADETAAAVTAIVTGRYPGPGEVRPDVSLFTRLAMTHRLHVVESVTAICPPAWTTPRDPPWTRRRRIAADVVILYLHRLLPPPLDQRLPPLGHRWGGFGSTESDPRSQLFARFIAEITADDPGVPGFHFLHVLLPHSPWIYLPSGRSYEARHTAEPPDGRQDDRLSFPPAAAIARERHLLQTRWTDHLVGRLVARLREVEIYDEALVIVTADHGIRFVAGESMRQVRTAADAPDLLRVPLLVKLPGQRAPRVDDRPVLTVDIAPTIAEIVGLSPDPAADGMSLLGPPRLASRLVGDSTARLRYPVDAPTLRPQPSCPGGTCTLSAAARGWLGRREPTDAPDHPAATVELHDAAAWTDVDPRAARVPLWVSGRIHVAGGEPLPAEVLVAIGGRFRAAGAIRPTTAGGGELGLLLDEDDLSPGDNILAIYAVEATGSLRKLPVER